MEDENQENGNADVTKLTGKKARGFASMSPERRRQISSLGGSRAQALGRAHVWTSEEAKAAGRKGGKASQAKRSA